LPPPQSWPPGRSPGSSFVSVIPKIAAFAGLLRFLIEVLPNGMSGWPVVLAVIAVVTMTFGSLVALGQTSLKRLLAYPGIAQASYMLMAVAVAERTADRLPAVGYYGCIRSDRRKGG